MDAVAMRGSGIEWREAATRMRWAKPQQRGKEIPWMLLRTGGLGSDECRCVSGGCGTKRQVVERGSVGVRNLTCAACALLCICICIYICLCLCLFRCMLPSLVNDVKGV